MSPHRSESMDTQDKIRKRVCKACDRCRLKKSKCDGASPCSRCKADNAICVFGERKKSQDKVYPKGYVEMLEQQQTQLVAGLRELYSRLQGGESWPGQPLQESSGGHPLTHDILERLNILQPSSESGDHYEGFEDDCNRMQRKLLERGAPLTHWGGSISSESEHEHGSTSSPPPPSHTGTPVVRSSFAFVSPFAHNNAPPTPPMISPFPRHSQATSPVEQQSTMVPPPFMTSSTLDASSLSRAAWTNDSLMPDETVDFSRPMYGFDTFGNFDHDMLIDPMTVNEPMMPDWNTPNELDFNSFLHNPIGA